MLERVTPPTSRLPLRVASVALAVALLPPVGSLAQSPSGETAAALAAPSGAGGGYEYVFRVSQETVDERGRVRREPAFVARARTRGGAVRVDFLPGTEGSNTPGDWYLTRDAGRTMTIVDTRAHAYHDLSVAAVRERLSDDKALDVTVSDLTITMRPEGDCGAVSGWPTHCVTVERRYTARTRHLLTRSTTQVVDRARFWLAPALPELTVPLGAFFVSRTDLLVRRDSAFVAREREVARALRTGSMLRMELTHTEANGRARAVTTRVVETSEVRRAAHDERLFDVPPGYRLLRR
jgi:hypothetical protein